MLTLYDVLELANDEEKLRKWMTKYKIVAPVGECPSCGAAMKPSEHMGKPYYRCTSTDCRMRVSAASSDLLEGSKLSAKEFLVLAYFWAHDCGGIRAA